MTKTITIVQNRPTQFDVPLYEQIADQEKLHLIVYYTQTHESSATEKIDPEIGIAPIWSHLGETSYGRRDLTEHESKDAQLVAKRIAADQPDLVVLSGYYPSLHAKLAILLRIKGIRIGLRSDNTIPHSKFSGAKGLLKRVILFNWLKLYDLWHPVGTLSQQYLEKISFSKKPTFLFPYSTSNDWFIEVSEKYRDQRSHLRRDLGIQSEDTVILGVMKWHPREDPLTLIDSFCQLRKSTQNVRLLLVGDGPLRNDVEEKLNEIKDEVILPGYVPYSKLPLLYLISDIFVHPAVNEPWGVSVSEAMACGLPVVVSEGVGASVDLVEEGKTGFIFPTGDSKALHDHLLNMAQDKVLRQKLADGGRKLLTNWSYDKTIDNFNNALSFLDAQVNL